MTALLFLATTIAQPDAARFQPSSAVARAEVRIRIISGATLTLGQSTREPAAELRQASVRIDGESIPARLIEFQ